MQGRRLGCGNTFRTEPGRVQARERRRSAPCSCYLLERLWRDQHFCHGTSMMRTSTGTWWAKQGPAVPPALTRSLQHWQDDSCSCASSPLLCFQSPSHTLGEPSGIQKLPKCLDHPDWWWRAWGCRSQHPTGRGNRSISNDIMRRSRGSKWLRRPQQVKNNPITRRRFNHTASRKHSLQC